MSAHAAFAPSSASRYFSCPGAFKAEQDKPDSTSAFAEEGTRAHALLAYMLDPAGQPYAEPDDEAMETYCAQCVFYVEALGLTNMKVEVRVEMDAWVPDCFGTIDILGRAGNTLHVIDLKYGKGVFVSPIDNEQLQIYALGAWGAYRDFIEIENIELHILQPRLDRMLSHGMDVTSLFLFGERLSQVWGDCNAESPDLNPGDSQCRFCKAAATCPALAEMNMSMARMEFGHVDLTMPVIEDLTVEQQSYIYKHKSLITKWLEKIQQHLTLELQSGREVPDYKLVEGRSLRKWNNSDEAEKALRRVSKLKVKDILKTSLISPAQAEKLLGKGHPLLQEQVNKPLGKPTIVPADDKRQEIRPAIETEFKEIEA
jgi:hypothetical protein